MEYLYKQLNELALQSIGSLMLLDDVESNPAIESMLTTIKQNNQKLKEISNGEEWKPEVKEAMESMELLAEMLTEKLKKRE